jgi:hypothetical protein
MEILPYCIMVAVVTRLQAGWPRCPGSFPDTVKTFSLLGNVQIGSGLFPAYCLVCAAP